MLVDRNIFVSRTLVVFDGVFKIVLVKLLVCGPLVTLGGTSVVVGGLLVVVNELIVVVIVSLVIGNIFRVFDVRSLVDFIESLKVCH